MATLLPIITNQAYINFESEYAFRYHFKRQANWGKVADFGGGIGQKTRKVNNVTVIDIHEESIEWMKGHGVEYRTSLVEFDDGAFDLIYCSGTLEHLDEPAKYLRLMNKKLKVGGKLFLSQPLDKSVFENTYSEKNGHLYTWTTQQINSLLRENGFEITENRTMCFLGIPFISRHLNGKMRYWDIQNKLMERKTVRKVLYFWAQTYCLFKEVISETLNSGKYHTETIGTMEVWAIKRREK